MVTLYPKSLYRELSKFFFHPLFVPLTSEIPHRWLLDSAERSGKVILDVITSGLVDGLKHSISRHDMTAITPSCRHKSRSRESINRLRVQKLLGSGGGRHLKTVKSEDKPSDSPVLPLRPFVHGHPIYAPSIGSQHGSNYSLVSSTVETAAALARSSIRSSAAGKSIPFKVNS